MEASTPVILKDLPSSAVKPLGTYAEVYAGMSERAQLIGQELIVRGAVPILQMRWRIGPEEAISILDELRKAGHILQRDGWRAIALLTKAIDDQTPVLPNGTRKLSSVGQRTSSTEDESRRRELPAPGSPATASAVPTQQVDTTTAPIDAAIESLEARLRVLHLLHTGVEREIASLETSVKVLKRVSEQGMDLSPQIREALRESALSSANLLAVLSEEM